jgi:hypothetical protein
MRIFRGLKSRSKMTANRVARVSNGGPRSSYASRARLAAGTRETYACKSPLFFWCSFDDSTFNEIGLEIWTQYDRPSFDTHSKNDLNQLRCVLVSLFRIAGRQFVGLGEEVKVFVADITQPVKDDNRLTLYDTLRRAPLCDEPGRVFRMLIPISPSAPFRPTVFP